MVGEQSETTTVQNHRAPYRLLGAFLSITAALAAYVCGVLLTLPKGAELIQSITASLSGLRDFFVLSGGAAIFGLLLIAWGALLLHRRYRSAYYKYE